MALDFILSVTSESQGQWNNTFRSLRDRYSGFCTHKLSICDFPARQHLLSTLKSMLVQGQVQRGRKCEQHTLPAEVHQGDHALSALNCQASVRLTVHLVPHSPHFFLIFVSGFQLFNMVPTHSAEVPAT